MSDTRSRRARHRPRHATTLRHGIVIPAVASVVLAVLGFYGMQGVATVAFASANANTADISSLLGDSAEYISAPVATDEAGEPVDVHAGEDLNILVIGSDVRTSENAAIGGYFDGARGDTTIIVHVSADRSRLELVSIPRDTRVAISDCESFDGQYQRGWTAKFNVAFSNGYGFNNDPAEAAACVMRTLNDLTGIDFDGQFVVADFAGFRDMVDALGGVPMCVPYDVYSRKAQLDLDAGAQVLNGTDALAWARARTGTNLGDGTDLMRIGRQQELIESMLRKALGTNVFTDMSVMTQFVKAATNSFTMSEEFADVTYDFGIAYSLRNIDLNNVTMVTAPWAYAGDGSGDVVLTYEAEAVWEAIRNDTPLSALTDASPSAEPTSETPTAVDTSDNEATMYLPIPPESSYIPDTERETEEEILAAC
ncbi:LCP family protein [Demequina zhanjiangensis]|uniref:LCP family protein n=1 Tax=Demequina zhanjiangensis TaxID=3051659 RepID=A0ABT8FY94_9MICO|nr:LCP family protein [Demequina sp. SYSU T00b26]MDN4471669.1 LCP family protein [Demequina sp. SYSU T00b26]